MAAVADASPLAGYAIKPRTRSFMCASTGSGKSTLSGGLLQEYWERYPRHNLYIFDPKRRFVPADSTGGSLFPDGLREVRHGHRAGVSINGDVIDDFERPNGREALLIQTLPALWKVLDGLYEHASLDRQSLLYCDELADIMPSGRADPRFRRVMKQGRELGIGVLGLEQAPSWIDGNMLRETEFLYIGRLNDPRDRKKLIPYIPEEFHAAMMRPFPKFRWLYVDRVDWDQSEMFDLEIS